jgi:hypothetical protein
MFVSVAIFTEGSSSPVTIVEHKSSIGSYSCMYRRKVAVDLGIGHK